MSWNEEFNWFRWQTDRQTNYFINPFWKTREEMCEQTYNCQSFYSQIVILSSLKSMQRHLKLALKKQEKKLTFLYICMGKIYVNMYQTKTYLMWQLLVTAVPSSFPFFHRSAWTPPPLISHSCTCSPHQPQLHQLSTWDTTFEPQVHCLWQWAWLLPLVSSPQTWTLPSKLLAARVTVWVPLSFPCS